MNQRFRPRAAAFLAVVVTVAVGLLAAPAAAATDEATEVAVAYLRARAAATAVVHPARALVPYVVAGSPLAAREIYVARGARLRQADLGHVVDAVVCDVSLRAVSANTTGDTVRVSAHAVTRVSWHASRGKSVEASGVDHTVTVQSIDGVWRVTADGYVDVQQPAFLERAGVPVARVRAAARRLEAASARAALAPAVPVSPAFAQGLSGTIAPAPRHYFERLEYDRAAARAYADRYALRYNPTYARFTGDCCNFVSQGARAGGMLMSLGDWTSGWWYDKEGTASPSDDSYSWSWISCSRQIAFWLGTRIDWVKSISDVEKGDVVYYDWTGDGSWDHVAILVGMNSANQKVIDAHTTDHYRVWWKLGTSSTLYKFGRVRAAWLL